MQRRWRRGLQRVKGTEKPAQYSTSTGGRGSGAGASSAAVGSSGGGAAAALFWLFFPFLAMMIVGDKICGVT